MPTLAGFACRDVTPSGSVWMDGMLRDQPSCGVHDPLRAKAAVVAGSDSPGAAFVLVSVDVCALHQAETDRIRAGIAAATGIPVAHQVIAATHTHSGPATHGFFNPKEEAYVEQLVADAVAAVSQAWNERRPALLGGASGVEDTISHYRRLLATDGHVVMNWEPYDEADMVGPLGVIDPEVIVLRAVSEEQPEQALGVVFNHTGHPNVMSGDNLLLSSEYPGLAERLLEERLGAPAFFVNGALGTMDIDGLRDRDWEGLERTGRALAEAVGATVAAVSPAPEEAVVGGRVEYPVPPRQITDEEFAWAAKVLEATGGQVQALADGVGDDYLAVLYQELRGVQEQPILVEQVCFAVGDTAFLSFPGELYTEIGQAIKAASPFARTAIVGLANGYIGYVPTRLAIVEGGYAESVRRVDAAAADRIVAESVALLEAVHTRLQKVEGVTS